METIYKLSLKNSPKEFPTYAKPFIKWVGGKGVLIKELKVHIPLKYGKYFEPFLGGGALFFDLTPHQDAILSDVNLDLMITYKVVRDKLADLISQLRKYQDNHSKDFYYQIRSQHNHLESDVLVAARFIYLNKTCFNGLYRVNSKGEFNVPMGIYKKPLICDEERLTTANKVLKGITIKNQSYENIMPAENDLF